MRPNFPIMDDDNEPRIRADAAAQLARESLDSYSLDELDQRVATLEAEIARVRQHRDKAAAHRLAADALFRSKS